MERIRKLCFTNKFKHQFNAPLKTVLTTLLGKEQGKIESEKQLRTQEVTFYLLLFRKLKD